MAHVLAAGVPRTGRTAVRGWLVREMTITRTPAPAEGEEAQPTPEVRPTTQELGQRVDELSAAIRQHLREVTA